MTTLTARFCLTALAASLVVLATPNGVSASVDIDFGSGIQHSQPEGISAGGATVTVSKNYQIHRLTRNKVRDANPYILGDTIYWERFGGIEGDIELFSMDISKGTKTRLTRNKQDDKLQAAGVWINSPYIRPRRGSYPFVPDRIKLNPLMRRVELFTAADTPSSRGHNRITNNRLLESSVKIADDPNNGMVWMTMRIPRENSIGKGVIEFFAGSRLKISNSDEPFGHHVFWNTGANKRSLRLTDTANAAEVAFDGDQAVWTTTSADEIVWYDVTSGTTRSVPADSPKHIDISGGYVKYTTSSPSFQTFNDGNIRFVGAQTEIHVYDTRTDQLISVGDPGHFNTDIMSEISDGYIVFNRAPRNPFRDFPSPHSLPNPRITELHLFDIATLSDEVIAEGSNIDGIQFNGDTVVWQMLDKSAPLKEDWDLEIFAYDFVGGTVRQVTDNDVDDKSPQISGDTIIWTVDLPGRGTEIFYETASSFILTDALLPETLDSPPMMSGGAISTAHVAVASLPEPASVCVLAFTGLLTMSRARLR